MQGRLGVYDRYQEKQVLDTDIQGVNNQFVRLNHQGGNLQQNRMIKDKRRSLDRALVYSYQGADVRKIDSTSDDYIRALINPNKLKQDYDDKIISVGYEHHFECGDIFEWKGTETYWLIYLQDLTELAYFRGDIRKCSHQINWEDENGKHSTYAAIRGPVETKINYIQKHGISVDNPNYSLNILLPKNETTLAYFKRYSKFYLKEDTSICWRVEATDAISMPGILEINAVEYYVNEFEDDQKEGIVGGLIEKVEDPNPTIGEIKGETFIKPKKEYTYTCSASGANWSYDSKLPIIMEVLEGEIPTVKIKWASSYSGQFDLYYGDFKKTIVVESLF